MRSEALLRLPEIPFNQGGVALPGLGLDGPSQEWIWMADAGADKQATLSRNIFCGGTYPRQVFKTRSTFPPM